jgi:hypothetical protein
MAGLPQMKTATIKVKRADFFTKAAAITALALLANTAMAESDNHPAAEVHQRAQESRATS